jgi:hypothetical protein
MLPSGPDTSFSRYMRWCFLVSHAETAVIHARSLAMLEIENRPFGRDVSEPLLVARNLVPRAAAPRLTFVRRAFSVSVLAGRPNFRSETT